MNQWMNNLFEKQYPYLVFFFIIFPIIGFLGNTTKNLNNIISFCEKIKQTKLTVDIDQERLFILPKKSSIVIQNSVLFTSKQEDLYLKKVSLFNSKAPRKKSLNSKTLLYHPAGNGSWRIDFQSPTDEIFLKKAIKGSMELNTESFIEFQDDWGSTPENKYEQNISNLKISKNAFLELTFIVQIIFDKHNEIPVDDWYFCFDYGNKKVVKKLTPELINFSEEN
ncbi:hypothetical protein [Picosynechococcus sp. PCC 7117]|uniref:hypothetical protein n=1 Tax=Picosynechococcus sp. PCC 7117 TaxID=195498 RepID=UPI0012EE6735|nr:hypothetical protein [Picosynechococcus sp. PCC 7117]